MTSDCCDAPVSVGGDGTTHWWICEDCGKPCDATPEEGWDDHPSLTVEERNRSLR